MATVAVIQARMGSTRLPGKVLADLGGRPLVAWTVAAVRAVPGVDAVVVAVTDEAADDPLVALLEGLECPVHRGPSRDVLTRCWDAVAPYRPTHVVRATADNPFPDPDAIAGQLRVAVADGLDYVGTAGWPLGIAAEVASATALEAAVREARDPAEREHVLPFIYARPERFRVGVAPPVVPPPAGRYTVDTSADLAFVRAIVERADGERPVRLATIAGIVAADPALLDMNRDVRQKPWQEAEA